MKISRKNNETVSNEFADEIPNIIPKPSDVAYIDARYAKTKKPKPLEVFFIVRSRQNLK